MPRTHGRIMASIWNDPDFLALEAGPQRLYLFLLSQPDLSHAGLVPMRIRRWAKKVALATESTIRADLGDLADSRFIATDEDTEEVLIRTFVRNDGVYKQPKVMVRLREDAKQIESPALRAVFRAELDRLPLDELSTNRTGVHADGPSTRESVETVVDALRDDFAEAMPYPSQGVSSVPDRSRPAEHDTNSLGIDVSAGQSTDEGVSGRVSDTPSDTPHVRAGGFPQPPTPTTVPHPPATIPRDKPSATLVAREPDRFEEFWNTYDKKVDRKGAEKLWASALKKTGVTQDLLIAAAAAYVLHEQTTNEAGRFVMDPSKWLRNERWRDERRVLAPQSTSRRQAETDGLFERALNRAQGE